MQKQPNSGVALKSLGEKVVESKVLAKKMNDYKDVKAYKFLAANLNDRFLATTQFFCPGFKKPHQFLQPGCFCMNYNLL